MPIISTELKRYLPAAVSDGAGNGGRMSATESAFGVKNNLWPDVPEAERTAGSTKYRKAFYKAANDDDLALQNSRLWLAAPTGAEDRVYLFPGTQRDTQGDLSGSEDRYGAGTLASDASSGGSTLVVDCEAAIPLIFRAGDTIVIRDGSNEEFHEIDTGGVSYDGAEATLTLVGTLAASYLAATPTIVSSVIEAGNLTATADNYATSTASGTYDDSGEPVQLDHIGSIEQTWTVTFTGATTFSVAGDVVGSVGTGGTGADFAPTNAAFSKPYFTLPSAGWGGTWALGETLVFQTHPAATPVWHQRVVPAGAASFSANDAPVYHDGESA